MVGDLGEPQALIVGRFALAGGSASMGAPTPERGGRAKRFFKITADGRRAVRRSQDALTAMTAAWRDARAKS